MVSGLSVLNRVYNFIILRESVPNRVRSLRSVRSSSLNIAYAKDAYRSLEHLKIV